MLGYRNETTDFFEFAVSSLGTAEFSVGTWDASKRRVSFRSAERIDAESNSETVLEMPAEDTFRFIRIESEDSKRRVIWEADFERC